MAHLGLLEALGDTEHSLGVILGPAHGDLLQVVNNQDTHRADPVTGKLGDLGRSCVIARHSLEQEPIGIVINGVVGLTDNLAHGRVITDRARLHALANDRLEFVPLLHVQVTVAHPISVVNRRASRLRSLNS